MKKKMVSMMMAIVLLAMAGCGASKDKETEGEDQKTTIKLYRGAGSQQIFNIFLFLIKHLAF